MTNLQTRVLAFLAVMCLLPALACATHTKEETDESDTPAAAAPGRATPKSALRAFDAALPAGGMAAAEAAYHATSASERRIAHALAEADLATAQLQQQTEKRFGAESVDVVIHAARGGTAGDLKLASEKIRGAKATVFWKSQLPPIPMIRVGGAWKVDVTALLAGLKPDFTVEQLEKVERDAAAMLRRTADEVAAGEFANAALLERAVSQRMYRLLGDEK